MVAWTSAKYAACTGRDILARYPAAFREGPGLHGPPALHPRPPHSATSAIPVAAAIAGPGAHKNPGYTRRQNVPVPPAQPNLGLLARIYATFVRGTAKWEAARRSPGHRRKTPWHMRPVWSLHSILARLPIVAGTLCLGSPKGGHAFDAWVCVQ